MKRGIEESSLRSLCFEATVRERGNLERSVCSVCAFSPIKEGGVNPRVRVCVFEEREGERERGGQDYSWHTRVGTSVGFLFK